MYLGSFQTLKGLHETVSKYRKIGLSPYWVKLDLGDKGTWYRLFAGYFRTREGADTFIKVKQIREAQLFHTKYANLIGTYTSAGVLDKKQTALLELGYSPYVINDKKDVLRLYVGAFSQKIRAEKQNAALASKDIQSRLIKR
jgi:cell division septation protein DedD